MRIYEHIASKYAYFFEIYNIISPSAIGTVLSTISPGVLGR